MSISAWPPTFFWGRKCRSCARSMSGSEPVSTIIMIWRWLIFFSAFLWVAHSREARAADLKGQVELTNSREAVVRRNKDYSGVVLWLIQVDPAQPAPIVPRHVEMVQKDKTFAPHVVAIPVGGTVDFPDRKSTRLNSS